MAGEQEAAQEQEYEPLDGESEAQNEKRKSKKEGKKSKAKDSGKMDKKEKKARGCGGGGSLRDVTPPPLYIWLARGQKCTRWALVLTTDPCIRTYRTVQKMKMQLMMAKLELVNQELANRKRERRRAKLPYRSVSGRYRMRVMGHSMFPLLVMRHIICERNVA
jgi:hypothetical protein